VLRVPLNVGKSAAYCQVTVGEFAVSGEWSPCIAKIKELILVSVCSRVISPLNQNREKDKTIHTMIVVCVFNDVLLFHGIDVS